MNKKQYFLCSEALINRFPEYPKSKPFKSGYKFDINSNYYVAFIDFNEVQSSVKTNPDPNIWCRECVPGLMDTSTITISSIIKKGLFVEACDLGLINESEIAMCIYNLSEHYNCTPIEFINKITVSK